MKKIIFLIILCIATYVSADVCQESLVPCEADFDCSSNVDAIDLDMFISDYLRGILNNPCTNELPCNGDFLCDGDVDGCDIIKLIEDFGRTDCPQCKLGVWCNYKK